MEGGSYVASNAKRGKSEGRNLRERQIQYTGLSFSNLPINILENIIIRLPIKGILVCKRVCKTWYNIVSDPEFAKLHFCESRICPSLRFSEVTLRSRKLFLLEAGIDDFECNLDMCCHNKLLLPSLQQIVKDKHRIYSRHNFERGEERLKIEDLKYRVVNSCNGLLCLADPTDNDPVIICNPITGEFINLPMSKTIKVPFLCTRQIACGFGFCPTTNQYKVIRMFTRWVQNDKGLEYDNVLVAEVNILGTKSWKDLGFYPETSYKLFPTYFNGCVYWLSLYYVIFFDFEKECFGSVPVPPLQSTNRYGRVSLGVLRGEFCISEAFLYDIKIWALKDNGAERDWSIVFYVEMFEDIKTWPRGCYRPIKCLNNGALLMFHPQTNCLVYKDLRKPGYKTLKFRGVESKLEPRMEALPHIPSLISLKRILAGHNVKVFNVKSRCEEESSECEIDSEDSEVAESDSEDENLVIDSEDSEVAVSDSEDENLEIDSEDNELVESDSEDSEPIESDSEDSEPIESDSE